MGIACTSAQSVNIVIAHLNFSHEHLFWKPYEKEDFLQDQYILNLHWNLHLLLKPHSQWGIQVQSP